MTNPDLCASMKPYLMVLEHLSYIIECAALDYMGEGKTELNSLANLLETDPRFAIDGAAVLAKDLREILAFYRGGERQQAYSMLTSRSRQLWDTVKAALLTDK